MKAAGSLPIAPDNVPCSVYCFSLFVTVAEG